MPWMSLREAITNQARALDGSLSNNATSSVKGSPSELTMCLCLEEKGMTISREDSSLGNAT